LIEAQGLTRRVPGIDEPLVILQDISLRVASGDAVAVVGPSGAGKSTLLALLAGLELPSEGRVLFQGVDLGSLSEDGRARLRRRNIGFVFQSFYLLPGLTAQENVMLPLELDGVRDAADRAGHWLERVGLAMRLGHYPHQLSGGEQQRVAIARAFASDPQLLFVDEPTGSLDTVTGAQISELLLGMHRDRNVSLIMVTHDEQLASRCSSLLRLEGGRLRS